MNRSPSPPSAMWPLSNPCCSAYCTPGIYPWRPGTPLERWSPMSRRSRHSVISCWTPSTTSRRARRGRGRREKVEEMNAENVHQDIDLAAPDLPREPEDAAGSAAADSDAGTALDTEAEAPIEPAAEAEPGFERAEPQAEPEPAAPPTGTMSAERLAAKALEARLLGG